MNFRSVFIPMVRGALGWGLLVAPAFSQAPRSEFQLDYQPGETWVHDSWDSAFATYGGSRAMREYRKWVRLDRIDSGTQIKYKFHYRDSIKKCTECDYDFVHTDSVVSVSTKGDTTFGTECYLDSLKNLMCHRALPFPLGTVFRSSDSLAGGLVVTDSSLVGFAIAKTAPVPIYGGTSFYENYVVKGVGLIYSYGRSSNRFTEVKRKWTLLQHNGKPYPTADVLGRLQALPIRPAVFRSRFLSHVPHLLFPGRGSPGIRLGAKGRVEIYSVTGARRKPIAKD